MGKGVESINAYIGERIYFSKEKSNKINWKKRQLTKIQVPPNFSGLSRNQKLCPELPKDCTLLPNSGFFSQFQKKF